MWSADSDRTALAVHVADADADVDAKAVDLGELISQFKSFLTSVSKFYHANKNKLEFDEIAWLETQSNELIARSCALDDAGFKESENAVKELASIFQIYENLKERQQELPLHFAINLFGHFLLLDADYLKQHPVQQEAVPPESSVSPVSSESSTEVITAESLFNKIRAEKDSLTKAFQQYLADETERGAARAQEIEMLISASLPDAKEAVVAAEQVQEDTNEVAEAPPSESESEIKDEPSEASTASYQESEADIKKACAYSKMLIPNLELIYNLYRAHRETVRELTDFSIPLLDALWRAASFARQDEAAKKTELQTNIAAKLTRLGYGIEQLEPPSPDAALDALQLRKADALVFEAGSLRLMFELLKNHQQKLPEEFALQLFFLVMKIVALAAELRVDGMAPLLSEMETGKPEAIVKFKKTDEEAKATPASAPSSAAKTNTLEPPNVAFTAKERAELTPQAVREKREADLKLRNEAEGIVRSAAAVAVKSPSPGVSPAVSAATSPAVRSPALSPRISPRSSPLMNRVAPTSVRPAARTLNGDAEKQKNGAVVGSSLARAFQSLRETVSDALKPVDTSYAVNMRSRKTDSLTTDSPARSAASASSPQPASRESAAVAGGIMPRSLSINGSDPV